MNSNNIAEADFLDLLFEGRNKAYGAYELRKTYNKRLGFALTVTLLVCLLVFLSSLFARHAPDVKKPDYVTELVIDPYKPETEKIPPAPRPARKQPLATLPASVPKIVKDFLVAEEVPLEVPEETRTTLISNLQQGSSGDDESGIVPPSHAGGTGELKVGKSKRLDYDSHFVKVEREAQFPGGPDAWKRYLERNLNAQVATEEGAAEGKYTVKVQFIVDDNGNISKVKAIEVPGACHGCGVEAERVIRRGGRWEPALQNGRKIIYQVVQHITFEVAVD